MIEQGKCLFCLKSLPPEQTKAMFHTACSQKFFDAPTAPELPYQLSDLHELAKHIVDRSIAVPGVQPKLSLAIEKQVQAGTMRFTLVGLWGNFILKPPTTQYPELVENEHLTMSLANVFGIETVPFSFIRLKSGELAYLTKRIDRTPKGKLAMEDFCQLSERLTEYKYRGSVEQIAKIIRRFSSNPGLDLANFLELVLFAFITGNADMHLKNYSLITTAEGVVRLAPAYDLVSTVLAFPSDIEESALHINGKKNKLKISDFSRFVEMAKIPANVLKVALQKFTQKMPLAHATIQQSALSSTYQAQYISLIETRIARLVQGE